MSSVRLVEEGENTEAENVTDYTKLLKAKLPDVADCLPAWKNETGREKPDHGRIFKITILMC